MRSLSVFNSSDLKAESQSERGRLKARKSQVCLVMVSFYVGSDGPLPTVMLMENPVRQDMQFYYVVSCTIISYAVSHSRTLNPS